MTKKQEKFITDNTYTTSGGTKFVFWQDIEKFMGKRMFKKFEKFMIGSTCILLPNGEGSVYPIDLMYFFNGYKVNPD